MSNCVKQLNLNGNVYDFYSEEEIKSFTKRNYHRLKLYELNNDKYINFSKDFNDSQSETIAIIDSILEEGKTIKSTINEFGDKEVEDQQSFIGVTKKLGSYTINGKPIIKRFDLDNYRKNALSIEIERLVSSGEFQTKDEALIQAKINIENNIKQFKQLGSFGTELHFISDLYFKEGVSNPDEIGERLTNEFNKEFKPEVIEKMLTIIGDLNNKILNDHGENTKIYTEIPIYDKQSKIVGIIDLLAIDNQGRAHIYDYKTSHKEEQDWGKTKINSIKYQMALYNQLLAKKGINTVSTNIVPIYLSDIDYNNNMVLDIEGNGKEETMMLIEDIYKNVANDILPVTISDYKKENINSTSIQEELQIACGYTIQNKFESVGTYQGDDGATYIRDRIHGRSIKLSDNPDIRKNQIKRYQEEYLSKENTEVQIIKNNVEQFIKNGMPAATKLYVDHNKLNTFISLFSRYTDGCWEIINDTELESQGIIAFENKYTRTIDFVSVTTNNINDNIKLSKGTTLIGNFKADRFLGNEKGLLKSTVSNIEGLKIAMWLNSNNEQFSTLKSYNLGEVRVCNPSMKQGAKGVNMNDIINNYAKLCKFTNVKFNLKNIKYQNPYDIILGKLIELQKNDNNIGIDDVQVTRHKTDKSWMISSLEDKTKGDIIGENSFENITQEERDAKLKQIEEMQRYIEDRNQDIKTVNLTDEISVLYGLLSNAYLYYKGLKPAYVEDIKEYSINNSSKLTPIQFHSNEMVKTLNDLWVEPKHNIGIKYKKTTDDINKVMEKYFEKKGFNRFSQIVQGDIFNQFKNLWVLDAKGNPTKDLMLKNPNDSSLQSYESEFIKYYLKIMDEHRYKSEEEKQEALENGNYYRMPLIRAQNIQRLKQKGIIQGTKDSFKNSINFNNFLEDDQETNLFYSENKKEIYNPYRVNSDGVIRQELINKEGVEGFDWDLQNIIRTFTLYDIKEKEFNRILPAMRNISSSVLFMNQGLTTGSPKNLIKFIDDFIKSVVFNEKLIEPHMKEAVKIGSQLKGFTGAVMLGFNVAGGVRDALQGFVSNTVITASKALGYKLDTKALAQAYSFMTKEGPSSVKNINLVDSINQLYMISTENINMLDKKHTIAKGYFTSEQLYFMNSLADYGNRMSLFVARLIEDGSLDAHKMKDGVLTYDWKLDDRFNVYKMYYKNPDNVPQKLKDKFNQQRGLYLALISDFNKNKSADTILKEGDDLPQAYTFKEISSIKKFSDLIHGYYDQDSKPIFYNTWFGVMFGQFKGWLFAKKDQYFLSHNSYDIGKLKQGVDVEGNLIWMKQNKEGVFELTNENTGIPYYAFEGSIMEGIATSLGRALKICYQSKFNLKEIHDIIKQDKLIPGNLKKLIGDLLIVFLMSIVFAKIPWNEFKKEKPVSAYFCKTIVKFANDLNPAANVEAMINPQSFIPSISIMYDLGKAVSEMTFGENHKKADLFYMSGALRPYAGIIDKKD